MKVFFDFQLFLEQMKIHLIKIHGSCTYLLQAELIDVEFQRELYEVDVFHLLLQLLHSEHWYYEQ